MLGTSAWIADTMSARSISAGFASLLSSRRRTRPLSRARATLFMPKQMKRLRVGLGSGLASFSSRSRIACRCAAGTASSSSSFEVHMELRTQAP
eukprot:scaffold109_cov252-Pinguiococcus_pyrenoidosus.AAC.82